MLVPRCLQQGGIQDPLKVRLKQLQLEQDSGKITYGRDLGDGRKETLVDYNRAGTVIANATCMYNFCIIRI